MRCDDPSGQSFLQLSRHEQVAVHDGAVAEARKLKPEIPEYDEAGTAINDEIEYDWILR